MISGEPENMITYTAIVEEDAQGWTIDVPDIPDLHCHVPRLDEATGTVRAAVAKALGVDPDSFGIEILRPGQRQVVHIDEALGVTDRGQQLLHEYLEADMDRRLGETDASDDH